MLVWDERDVYKERLLMPIEYCCSKLKKKKKCYTIEKQQPKMLVGEGEVK